MDNLEKKVALCLILALAIAIFIPVYWLREPGRQAAAIARIQAESIQKGQEVFVSACGSCHGKQAQGGAGPALGGKDAALVQKAVRDGKGIMPAFSVNQISNADLEDIIVFLSSAMVSPPTTAAPTNGDPVALGEQLYQSKAGCAGCHGKDARGGAGPAVRGSTADKITAALKTSASMSFIKLTEDEVKAIAAYLIQIESQK